MQFIEIGMDEDHAHFLIQSVPMMYIPDIVKTVKSIVAREIFMMRPEVKRMLWGGHFWTAGYYVNTVGAFATEQIISKYVREQGKQYKKIHSSQLKMFEGI